MTVRILHIVIVTTLTLWSFTLRGQMVSQDGLFSLPEGSGCAPYGANGEFVFNAPLCDGSIACAIDFNFDGTFETDPSFPVVLHNVPIGYTYNTPGTYRIMIIFGAGGPSDELTFTVYPSTPPDFNVYVCSGNSVQLEITDTNFSDYIIDYDNDNSYDEASSGGFVPPHSYGSSGAQTITVQGNFTNCSKSSKTVTTTATFPTGENISRLESLSPNEIQLDISGSANDNILYQLDRRVNNGAFTEVSKFTNMSTLNDLTVNSDQSFYCYRVGAIDICNSPAPNFTNTVCSVSPELVIGDGQNEVSWSTNAVGATSLEVVRNGVTIPRALANSGTYIDTDVNCGTQYCYRYILRYGPVESISHELCGVARSSKTPPPLQEITTIVTDNNAVQLEWVPLDNYTVSKYDIFKIPDIYLPEASSAVPSYLDNGGYNAAEGNCYQLRFDDVCTQRSNLSADVCTLHLIAIVNETTNAVDLSWQPYAGYASGVNRYVIEKYNNSGGKIDEFDAGTQTTYVDSSPADGQIFSYIVKAFSNTGDVANASLSNRVTIILSPRLWHPTAFVPDGSDPQNGRFSVRGSPEHIANYELRIFNRWGELMYFSTSMDNSWDGTYKGVKMPEGSYVFRTRITDRAGRTFDYAGAVLLLRK